MAEERLMLEPEVQQIFGLIDVGQNFLLSGGAGSGKTYSLVSTIRQSLRENPAYAIACITFTNAAVREILERIEDSNLRVSTIHDFLWDVIGHFQIELKAALVDLINDSEYPSFKIDPEIEVGAGFFDHLDRGIQYKEYLRISEGIISHDELLIVAEKLFAKYPKLCTILQSKAKLILVDEYQDTSPSVIRILLEHLTAGSGRSVIGFFGDAMQAIYGNSIGTLANYIGTGAGTVTEIQKAQNRRNPTRIIDLANLLRTDGLKQEPSGDPLAPNMLTDGSVKQGEVLFIHSGDPDVENARRYLEQNFDWDFTNPRLTKELNLTHNLIADTAGFRGLMDIYDKDRILTTLKSQVKEELKARNIVVESEMTFGEVIDFLNIKIKPTVALGQFINQYPDLYDKARQYYYKDFRKVYVNKDQLLEDKKQTPEDEGKKGSKRDALISHLYRIEEMVRLYESGNHNEFLRKIDFRITSIASKRELREGIELLTRGLNTTIEDAIVEADRLAICRVDDKLARFMSESEYVYERVKLIDYKELRRVYDYVQGYTPFSTQHKTKGAEFDNVFVNLDNGKWNEYNFTNLFLRTGTPSTLEKTQKLFYVCCTRAKEKLAVFFHNPNASVISQANVWFGTENVIKI